MQPHIHWLKFVLKNPTSKTWHPYRMQVQISKLQLLYYLCNLTPSLNNDHLVRGTDCIQGGERKSYTHTCCNGGYYDICCNTPQMHFEVQHQVHIFLQCVICPCYFAHYIGQIRIWFLILIGVLQKLTNMKDFCQYLYKGVRWCIAASW